MTRVIICDDQEVVREGLRTIVELVPDLEVVGAVPDGSTAIELLETKGADVVLMDLHMPGMNGVQATREITNRFPDTSVLVLTTYADESWVLDAVRAGAIGYLLKDSPRDRLVDAIRGTAEGRSHIDPAVAGSLLTRAAAKTDDDASTVGETLSPRELEVLGLLGRGLSNAAIAERLYLSEGTVRNYVSAVLSKLGVEDRTQAAVLAVRHGIE